MDLVRVFHPQTLDVNGEPLYGTPDNFCEKLEGLNNIGAAIHIMQMAIINQVKRTDLRKVFLTLSYDAYLEKDLKLAII